MAANPNDTDGARVVGGERPDGALGSRTRVEKEAGELAYDTSRFNGYQQDYGNNRKLKDDKGKAIAQARAFSLPEMIRGNPLGCGCDEAHLVGATQPIGSHIEADYMCDSGWHNYVVFELIGFENKGESQIKVDSNGNLVEDTKTEARELGEF